MIGVVQPLFGAVVILAIALAFFDPNLEVLGLENDVGARDREFARAGGHADVFINTGFIRALLCRLVTEWMGDAGFLQRLGFTMRCPHLAGDTISVRGRVTRRRAEAQHDAVDLDVWIENPRDGIATPGTATVQLPR